MRGVHHGYASSQKLALVSAENLTFLLSSSTPSALLRTFFPDILVVPAWHVKFRLQARLSQSPVAKKTLTLI